MKQVTWRRHHKWLGLILAFFLVMFCLSGIVLNHPQLFSDVQVSRSWLPHEYRYRQWNRGMLRGTLRWDNRVLVYGANGVWETDTCAQQVRDFNRGLPYGADHRNIRTLVQTRSGHLFAVGQYGLYAYSRRGGWQEARLPDNHDGRLCDATVQGDSLVVSGRSHLYLGVPPYRHFTQIKLRPAADSDGRVSLFRTVWLFHSGALFGMVGRLFVDGIAVILLFLTLSGAVYGFWPSFIRPRPLSLRRLLKWHNHVGRWTIVPTLLLCVSGWLLRPPLLIAIASARIPALPFSTMRTDNAWDDQIRSLRYDAVQGDWLLSSANGFYALPSLAAVPERVPVQPPVSVMGISAQRQMPDGRWLIGSFRGMFVWNRQQAMVTDFFTRGPVDFSENTPVGAHAISGCSMDFNQQVTVADYNEGIAGMLMPQWMECLPMSLRSLCLEIHTGRIYTFLGMGTILYIFIIGLAVVWCLWSGWKICRNR